MKVVSISLFQYSANFSQIWYWQIWCMCDRASYMKMTRGTNLMQQF